VFIIEHNEIDFNGVNPQFIFCLPVVVGALYYGTGKNEKEVLLICAE
jgi:hypothetical protein